MNIADHQGNIRTMADAKKSGNSRLIVIALLGVVTLVGCASTRPNLQPFAEQTVFMLAHVQAGLRSTQIVELSHHAERPESLRVTELWGEAQIVLRAIGNFSIEVVTAVESGEENTPRLIADIIEIFLTSLAEQSTVELRLATERQQEILASIRSQSRDLDALQAAQPVVDEAARIASEILGMLDVAHGELTRVIQTSIDEDFATVKYADDELRFEQAQLLLFMDAVLDYRRGDAEGRQKIIERMGQNGLTVKDPDRLSLTELQHAEELGFNGLTRIHTMRQHIQHDLDLYRAQQTELNGLATTADEAHQKALVTVVVWSRAYRRLSLGMKVGGLMNLTRSVVGLAL